MNFKHIAGYKFIDLEDLPVLQTDLMAFCRDQNIKGTILLSAEGININLAGLNEGITAFVEMMKSDKRFYDIRYHETVTEEIPYQRLKVKIKKEIITMGQAVPSFKRAASLSPKELKEWIKEGRDFILLDTRNNYEIEIGAFQNAINLGLSSFTEFPEKAGSLTNEKPIVMYCTGGIRCEKAALFMQAQGYEDVYQLDGGIIGYFREVGEEYYQGECFVFDERISVKAV